MCDRDNRRAGIKEYVTDLQKTNQNTSWESKSIHCAMKPIRMQLECPYNSSNDKKNKHEWVCVFIFIAQAMHFSEYQHVRAQKCYSFYTTV